MTVEPPIDKFDGRGHLLAVTYRMTVYLTVREVATMARCEHKSVRRAIAAGRLRAFRPTNKLLIREDDACAWIEGRPVSLTGSAPNLRSAPSRRRPTLGSQRPGSVADLREIERKAVRA
jgi:excisionase family DNA binding protein